MPWNVIKRLGAGIDTPVILCFLQGPKMAAAACHNIGLLLCFDCVTQSFE